MDLTYLIQFIQGWSLLILILTVVSCCVASYYSYVYYVHSKYDHIPGPPRESFLAGNNQLIEREIKHLFFQQILLKLAKQYGNTFKMIFFHVPFVVTIDPDSVKDLLVTGHHPKSKLANEPTSYLWGARFLGNGLATETDHKKWAFRRALMNPCFQKREVSGPKIMTPSLSYLRKLTTEFNIVADALVTKLAEMADGSTKVALLQEFHYVTLDVLGKIAFGLDINSLQSENNKFTQAILMSFKGLSKRFKVSSLFALNPLNWKFIWDVRKACKFLRQFGNTLLNDRMNAKTRGDYIPDDILTHIIKIKEENPDIDNEEILDDFVTFFVAGQETTANLLGFMVEYLGRNPHILKRLQEEIDNVVGEKSIIEYSDLDRLVFLDMVMKETLRLASPASMTFREVKKDHMVGGYKVPAGTSVIVSSYISGRTEAFHENPEKFDPERFSPNAEKRVDTYTYFPFTLGPRTCIGKHFADIEAKIVMTKFIQRFEFDLDTSRPFEMEEITTIRPKGGVMCALSLKGDK